MRVLARGRSARGDGDIDAEQLTHGAVGMRMSLPRRTTV
jgi:hypothetical protein